MSTSTLQLLAFTSAPIESDLPDGGVGPLRTASCGPHFALLRETAPGEYDGADAEQKLSDLEWISRRAIAHQMALDAASQRAATCPLPLGVLFSNEAALDEFANRNRGAVADFFAATTGRMEYGVKLLQSVNSHESGAVAHAVSGADRLRKKLAARRGAQRRSEEVSAFVGRVGESLAALAPETRTRQVMKEPGEDSAVALTGFAVLANEDEYNAIERWVQGTTPMAHKLGVNIELSGPWPPYAFCPELS